MTKEDKEGSKEKRPKREGPHIALTDHYRVFDEHDRLQLWLRRGFFFGVIDGVVVRESRNGEQNRDYPAVDPSPPPSYVITAQIPSWSYNPEIRCIRRVFKETNQGIELDVKETISWLGAHLADSALERKAVETEGSFDNINNQKVMQEMYERVKAGKSMLQNSQFYNTSDKGNSRAHIR